MHQSWLDGFCEVAGSRRTFLSRIGAGLLDWARTFALLANGKLLICASGDGPRGHVSLGSYGVSSEREYRDLMASYASNGQWIEDSQ